jgi:hypothetical protein
MTTDTFTRLGPYAERLVANEYVQDNLREAAVSLQSAYARISKRKGAAAEDKKLYSHLRRAAGSLAAAREALVTGRRKPKRSKRRIAVIVLALAGAGGAVAIGANEDLRKRLTGEARTEHT